MKRSEKLRRQGSNRNPELGKRGENDEQVLGQPWAVGLVHRDLDVNRAVTGPLTDQRTCGGRLAGGLQTCARRDGHAGGVERARPVGQLDRRRQVRAKELLECAQLPGWRFAADRAGDIDRENIAPLDEGMDV